MLKKFTINQLRKVILRKNQKLIDNVIRSLFKLLRNDNRDRRDVDEQLKRI